MQKTGIQEGSIYTEEHFSVCWFCLFVIILNENVCKSNRRTWNLDSIPITSTRPSILVLAMCDFGGLSHGKSF